MPRLPFAPSKLRSEIERRAMDTPVHRLCLLPFIWRLRSEREQLC